MTADPREPVDVLIVRLDPDLPLPRHAHPGDAGLDLFSTVDATVAPGERALLPTGISIALPDGYAAFVHPRSGLAIREGLTVANAPGTVDAGYRGEIQVALVNLDPHNAASVRRGDRIAQLVVQQVEKVLPRLPALGRLDQVGRIVRRQQSQPGAPFDRWHMEQ